MPITAGVDVGAGGVKCAVLDIAGDRQTLLGANAQRIRRRNLKTVIEDSYDTALRKSGVTRATVEYVATTGEGDAVDFRTGHFYSMTAHARGALFLHPEARGVLDLGALHTRAIKMDERGKVLQYRMTSQCASGSGQFLENIARYLGVSLEEVGEKSLRATKPERISSICAVLSETDVINMVARGISTENILKGIHLSISSRLVKLLRAIRIESTVLLTGGLASDIGLVRTLEEEFGRAGREVPLVAHEHSIYAGAIGAAIWGEFRLGKLKNTG